jgi:hypothetical protein
VRILIARLAAIVGITLVLGGGVVAGAVAVADTPGMTHNSTCRTVSCMTHN